LFELQFWKLHTKLIQCYNYYTILVHAESSNIHLFLKVGTTWVQYSHDDGIR